MALPIVNGIYFERVQVLFNNNIEFDSQSVGRVSVTGDQGVLAVDTMTNNHIVGGFTRGNAKYSSSISFYPTTNSLPPDFVNIDYDLQQVDLALWVPDSNYGPNVFDGAEKYYLMSGLYLANNDEIVSSGVGQPVTTDLVFKYVFGQWIINNSNAV